MKVELLNVPFDPDGGFDGEAIAAALAGADIAQVIPIPWSRQGVPGLTLLVSLASPAPRGRSTDQWRAQLATADRPLFDALRAWRKAAAADRDLAAFIVCTNAVLARVAALRPRDADELAAVPGIGPATLERYGDELLKVLHQQAGPSDPALAPAAAIAAAS
jgi:ribonuclease D